MTQIPESSATFSAMGTITHVLRRFVVDFFYLPRWHKGVLGICLLSMTVGWTHWGYHALTDSNPTATTQSTTNVSAADSTTQQPSILGMWARRVGGSVLVGFIIGWAFRTFLRTMAVLTTFVVGAIGLLSYFNIMNVDLTVAEKKYADASTWMTDQAGKLRDAALTHVHSTAGGTVGLFMGVKKENPPISQLLREA
jgi:uncharacterized membrane protein (Fun14 family)